jgi:hypothetical protein
MRIWTGTERPAPTPAPFVPFSLVGWRVEPWPNGMGYTVESRQFIGYYDCVRNDDGRWSAVWRPANDDYRGDGCRVGFGKTMVEAMNNVTMAGE